MSFTTFRSAFHVGWINQNKHSTLNSLIDTLPKRHEPELRKNTYFWPKKKFFSFSIEKYWWKNSWSTCHELDNSNNDGNRRKNRRKQQNNFNSDDMQPVMIPSPDPSMGPGGMMNVPGLNEPQWGSNVGVVTEDPEMTRNRQFGYAVMACAVVALAVLMVSLSRFRGALDDVQGF